jgi:hypothetical protein
MVLTYRISYLLYTISQRILNKEGLSLSRTDYYNLYRKQKITEIYNKFEALVYALNKVGFRYICKADSILNEADELISR